MTWWSEHSAVPRFVLASSAIRCRFVDRFAGSRVPSRVSGQRFSTHGAPLPSAGSRRARFPAFPGHMRALRLPARAAGSLILFGRRSHALLHLFVLAEALLGRRGGRSQAWNHCSAGVPILRRVAPVDASGISQVPWRSVQCLCPAPRPRPSRQVLAMSDLSTPPPAFQHRRPRLAPDIEARSHGFSIRRLRFAKISVAAAAQDWLPAGGLRLCREGVEPSGSLRKVSGHMSVPLSRSCPVAMETLTKRRFLIHLTNRDRLNGRGYSHTPP
jgi:hypothetical protein